jgi:hypothetical protein
MPLGPLGARVHSDHDRDPSLTKTTRSEIFFALRVWRGVFADGKRAFVMQSTAWILFVLRIKMGPIWAKLVHPPSPGPRSIIAICSRWLSSSSSAFSPRRCRSLRGWGSCRCSSSLRMKCTIHQANERYNLGCVISSDPEVGRSFRHGFKIIPWSAGG